MDPVGDKAQPQILMQTQRPLDDVIMAMHVHGATISQMCEHTQAGVDGGLELLYARITVTG